MNEENCLFREILYCDKCDIKESCTLTCKDFPLWALVQLKMLRKMVSDER